MEPSDVAAAIKLLAVVTPDYGEAKLESQNADPSPFDTFIPDPCKFEFKQTEINPDVIPQSLVYAECKNCTIWRCAPIKYLIPVLEKSKLCDGMKTWKFSYRSVTVGFRRRF